MAADEHPNPTQTRHGHSSIQAAAGGHGHILDDLDHETTAYLDTIVAYA